MPRRVFVCFDADAAGSAATAKSVEVLNAAGCAAFIVQLPPGEDPDTFIRSNGSAAFTTRLDAAVPAPNSCSTAASTRTCAGFFGRGNPRVRPRRWCAGSRRPRSGTAGACTPPSAWGSVGRRPARNRVRGRTGRTSRRAIRPGPRSCDTRGRPNRPSLDRESWRPARRAVAGGRLRGRDSAVGFPDERYRGDLPNAGGEARPAHDRGRHARGARERPGAGRRRRRAAQENAVQRVRFPDSAARRTHLDRIVERSEESEMQRRKRERPNARRRAGRSRVTGSRGRKGRVPAFGGAFGSLRPQTSGCEIAPLHESAARKGGEVHSHGS